MFKEAWYGKDMQYGTEIGMIPQISILESEGLHRGNRKDKQILLSFHFLSVCLCVCVCVYVRC